MGEWGWKRDGEGGEGVQRQGFTTRFRVGNKPRPSTRFPFSVRTVWGRVGKARPRSALALPFSSARARAPIASPRPQRPRGLRVETGRLGVGPRRRCQIRSARFGRLAGPALRSAGPRSAAAPGGRGRGAHGSSARTGPRRAGGRRASPRSGGARGGLRRRRARCVRAGSRARTPGE